MSFKIDGLDELQNQLKKMEQGAKELGEKSNFLSQNYSQIHLCKNTLHFLL